MSGHPEDVLTDCQLLVVNPAVRPDHPLVLLARSLKIEVTTEIALFLRHNPAFVHRSHGQQRKIDDDRDDSVICCVHAYPEFEGNIWLGGNIGISLLDQVFRSMHRRTLSFWNSAVFSCTCWGPKIFGRTSLC